MTNEEINEENKDYTTPEQSKRLLELGVPAKSANMYYYDMGSGFIYAPDMIESKKDSDYLVSGDSRYLPCWTTGRLLWIINKCVEARYDRLVIFMNLNLHIIENFIGAIIIAYEVLCTQKTIGINFSKLNEKL